jgi:hypothetical protein
MRAQGGLLRILLLSARLEGSAIFHFTAACSRASLSFPRTALSRGLLFSATFAFAPHCHSRGHLSSAPIAFAPHFHSRGHLFSADIAFAPPSLLRGGLLRAAFSFALHSHSRPLISPCDRLFRATVPFAAPLLPAPSPSQPFLCRRVDPSHQC